MVRLLGATLFVATFTLTSPTLAAETLDLLILDGQNNHNWKATTPVMEQHLKASGLFRVTVATSPPRGQDLSGWKPKFSDYDVVLSNYNGDPWSAETQEAFVQYLENGGGFVCVHAANNAFGKWNEYNEIIGLGGWGGRNEASGPYVYFKDGTFIRDTSAGRGGNHGAQHEFQVVVRDHNHPITDSMPSAWLHAKDELYDQLRGPAVNMRVLATAFSPVTKRHEPMMMVLQYGKGRIFHTPMGHADYSMKCAGYLATLIRGAEWAATGRVSTPIPDDFPTADETSSRD